MRFVARGFNGEDGRMHDANGFTPLQAAMYRRNRARDAAKYLRLARACLVDGGSPAAAEYVRRALKSVEGAERHANRLIGENAASA
jgi:hypothetical protein